MRHADPAESPLAQAARWVYERVPSFVEDLYQPLHGPRLLWQQRSMPIGVLRGVTKRTCRPVRVIVAGTPPRSDLVPLQIFAEPPQREALGSVPIWSLPRALCALDDSADVLFAKVSRSATPLFRQRDWLLVPAAPVVMLDAQVDFDQLKKAKSSVRSDLRVVRRTGFEPEFTHTPEDCDAFTDGMHIPYMRSRHDALALAHSAARLRRMVRQGGGIAWARLDGQRVAGCVFQERGDLLRFFAFGVRDGDVSLVKAGALAALYVFILQYARERGFRRVELGGAGVRLNSRLLLAKLKWGGWIDFARPSDHHYLFRWPRPNAVTLDILHDMPLIARRAGQPVAVTALSGNAGDDLKALARFGKTAAQVGLRRIVVLTESESVAKARRAEVGEALAAAGGPEMEIALCSAERYLAPG